MATYVVGDIQGCYATLDYALTQMRFDPAADTLWCAGDLVNRGPDSLRVLRLLHQLGNSVIAVLGNHDLHLLALAAGNLKYAEKSNLNEVLTAPDSADLIHWLQQRPLLHWDATLEFAMLHAGLPPQWNLTQALAHAAEVERALRNNEASNYLTELYGHEPSTWSDSLTGMSRLRYITNCFTRLRYCRADGTLMLHEKGQPGTQSVASAQPWFSHLHRASRETRIVSGHWSTLGYYAGDNVWALDTGCVWGQYLTFLRIDQPEPGVQHYPAQEK
ncbi:MAG: symmetrical bis(5'-nucleosyl)-tetraphosphatase [Pseudomonadota bacterium]